MVTRLGCATSASNGMEAITTFSIQYGKGAASNFSTSIEDPNPFLKSSERLLIADICSFSPTSDLPSCRYSSSKEAGRATGTWVQRLGVVRVRPEVFFTKYLSLAFEGGFDHTEGFVTTQNGKHAIRMAGCANSRSRRKSGQAASFSAGRCCVRFLTYANWSNGFAVWSAEYRSRTEPAAHVWSASGNMVVAGGFPEIESGKRGMDGKLIALSHR